MQTVPNEDARLSDLYAYYYAHACAKQLGVKLNENARTLVEAFGGSVDVLDLVKLDFVKVDEAAWRGVWEYLYAVGRAREFEEAGSKEAEAYGLVDRLWGESFELPLEERRGV
jgi:hypothetical protein